MESICFVCRKQINNEKIDLYLNTTKYSRTNLYTFIINLCQNIKLEFSNENIICTSCLTIINDLDFNQMRCSELRKTLMNYLSNESNKFDVIHEHENDTRENECSFCQKKFSTKNGMELHIKRKHKTDKSSDVIEEQNATPHSQQLNATFSEQVENIEKKKHKKARIEIVQVLSLYKCDQCDKTWKTAKELKSHILTHNNERPYICEVCGHAYKHKSALDVHIGMHNGINPFTCKYCNKSFTQKGALQRHLPIHTGEHPYQCDMCGKTFIHHTSFSIHRLYHTGKKDYKCKLCDTALMSASHLKRHMRVHTGEKNFECLTCGKKFAERYNLASHQKLHENPVTGRNSKKVLRCLACNTHFDSHNKLNTHKCHMSEILDAKQNIYLY